MKYIWFYDNTPIGKIGIAANDMAITNMYFGSCDIDANLKKIPLIQNAYEQLEEYLKRERKTFDLPLAPKGTTFQQTVWKALENIPYGETRSYKQLAIAVGNEKACRAVGMANNRNPIPIFIPCHRVIGVDGGLRGYLGGIKTKQLLLELEA